MKVMKVSIDRDGCTSCGLCISLCPNVFHMGDDNKAVVTTDIVQEEFRNCATESAESCPVSVIHVTEEEVEMGNAAK